MRDSRASCLRSIVVHASLRPPHDRQIVHGMMRAPRLSIKGHPMPQRFNVSRAKTEIDPLLVLPDRSMVPSGGRVGRLSAVARHTMVSGGAGLCSSCLERARADRVVSVVLPTTVVSFELHHLGET